MNAPRPFLRYDSPHAHVIAQPGIDADTPTAGFYRMRLRSGGAYVGVRIWHGLPVDPATGEEMDRAACWNAKINGTWSSIDHVWPRCAGEPINPQEYEHLCGQQAWAAKHAPTSALADPRRKIDPLTSPLTF